MGIFLMIFAIIKTLGKYHAYDITRYNEAYKNAVLLCWTKYFIENHPQRYEKLVSY